MGTTTDRIEREMGLVNDVMSQGTEFLTELDNHRLTTNAVRAWRLNIGRSLGRLSGDKAKDLSEDELNELNSKINEINKDKEDLDVAVILRTDDQANDYLKKLKNRKRELTALKNQLGKVKIANSQEILKSINDNLSAVEANKSKVLAWQLDNQNKASEADLEELKAMVIKMNSEIM